jgi:hypothetical protein
MHRIRLTARRTLIAMNAAELQRTALAVGTAAAVVAGLTVGAWAWTAGRAWRVPAASTPARAAVAWPDATSVAAVDWSVLRRPAAPPPAVSAAPGGLAGRFRLAGTFLMSGGGNPAADRRAILDDLLHREQFIVGEGLHFEDIDVLNVLPTVVVLRRGAEVVQVALSFAGAGAPAAAPTGTVAAAGEAALENTRFGRRVGPSRWVLNREELTKYYRELLEDPERIAALYLSMKPDYDAARQVTGYQVNIRGEGDFFRAVGLQEGDVVRKVNSMNMTSQRRAEMFISQFLKSELNAFVFDVERGGQPEKLVYLLR